MGKAIYKILTIKDFYINYFNEAVSNCSFSTLYTFNEIYKL
jgi:hypothetical protein